MTLPGNRRPFISFPVASERDKPSPEGYLLRPLVHNTCDSLFGRNHNQNSGRYAETKVPEADRKVSVWSQWI